MYMYMYTYIHICIYIYTCTHTNDTYICVCVLEDGITHDIDIFIDTHRDMYTFIHLIYTC